MIWTVVLKNGESFVVHGGSFDRNTEVRNCLRARRLSESAVAGIIQGNHHVDKFVQHRETYSKQVKAALSAPYISDHEIADKIIETILAGKKNEDKSPVDEDGRPFNDPAKW